MREGIELAVDEGSRAFALLDRNLRVVQATGSAMPLMAAWGIASGLGGSSSREAPLVLKTVCRELHQEWQVLVQAEPDTTCAHSQRRMAHPHLPGVVADVTMVCPANSTLSETDVPHCFGLTNRYRSTNSGPHAAIGGGTSRRTGIADGCSDQEIPIASARL